MPAYENPVIPGFYPDPSVCRVGADYYLATSSFEFFPGVPLFHSRDLIHWEQLGHVLTRESQLPLAGCRASGGVFAPTLRCRDGRFYLTTTNVTGGGNFFVWTDDIRGEWSDPVWIDHEGIDPSLFWDTDGRAYLIATHNDERGVQCIGQFEIDLKTGRRLGPTRPIWYGSGGKAPEGPHMYRINGWYYLMIAEGGTEYGHMETIARSRSVWGPFEGCPRNPILTHVNAAWPDFQAVGHGDLIQTPDGDWRMLFHGIRPSTALLHHIGRETLLAPVTWDAEGWPVVNGGKRIERVMRLTEDGDEGVLRPSIAWRDDFSAPRPLPRWSFLRNPRMDDYAFGDGLTLRGGAATLDEAASPAFLGVRQQGFDLRFRAALRLSGAGTAGATVFHTHEHHYDLCVQRAAGGLRVSLRRRVVDMLMEQTLLLPDADEVLLQIDAHRLRYDFYAGPDAKRLSFVGSGCTQLLSTECMNFTFTGCFFALFAQGDAVARFPFASVETLAAQ